MFTIQRFLSDNNYSENVYIGNESKWIEFGYTAPLLDKKFQGDYTYTLEDEGCELQFILSSNQELNSFKEQKNLSFNKNINHGFTLVKTKEDSFNSLVNIWDNIALTEDEPLVVNALKLIDKDINDFAFLGIPGGMRMPFVKKKSLKGRFSLNDMGDGVLRLLFIILSLLKARDGFLLIDEFENGLHYSVQPEVWRLIFELAKRYNIQVFATTHSWDCIESFAKVAKEREDLEGVLFRMGRSVRKSDNGKIIATEFDEDELYNLTKDNIEVR